MRRCPECGEVCAYLYLRGIDVLGCECCVGMIDAVEIEEETDEGMDGIDGVDGGCRTGSQ